MHPTSDSALRLTMNFTTLRLRKYIRGRDESTLTWATGTRTLRRSPTSASWTAKPSKELLLMRRPVLKCLLWRSSVPARRGKFAYGGTSELNFSGLGAPELNFYAGNRTFHRKRLANRWLHVSRGTDKTGPEPLHGIVIAINLRQPRREQQR